MGSREGPTMRAAQFDGKVMAERLYGRANGSTSLTAGGNGKSQLPLMREPLVHPFRRCRASPAARFVPSLDGI